MSTVPIVDWLAILARELALWGGILLLLASVLSAYHGWGQWRRASVIDETPRRDVAEVRSPVVVRIRGEIEPLRARDTFVSPVGGHDGCVLSAWEIEEMYDTPKTRSWEKSA